MRPHLPRLRALAESVDQPFCDLFLNPSDIGGRLSALSLFGLVPAALMGIGIDSMLASRAGMTGQCRVDDPEHSLGLALGGCESLERPGRRAMQVHLPRRDALLLERVVDKALEG